MGLFKSIKKAFKKVTRGIKKAVKGVVKGVKKVVKKIASSKIFKAIVIAAAIYVTGGAAISAFSGGTATGFAGSWMAGATNLAAGTGFTATGAAAGTWTAAAQTAAGVLATPFAAAGRALGTAAAAVTDFTGLTTEATRTNAAQRAAIAGQTTTTAATPLTQDQILEGLNPAEVAQAQISAFEMPSTTVESQLASSTQAAFNAGSGTTTAGGLNIPSTLPSASYSTGIPAQQLAQTVPSALGVPPVEATASAAEKLSLAQRYPGTTAFLKGAGMTAANTLFGAYANSLFQGDGKVNPEGSGEEGASRFSPVAVYSNELDINPDDYYKYFTFSNVPEANNMPLVQQQTLAIT